ncbi:scamp family-domain-containing protein [Jimgerdemannia flammicorona]|uniref:Scamp family-domain-containing protein n=1 Tax=Jimgerdemannia flammicorona TaxID=994334 RepID=A0A433QKJ1_9FUNG|nr:scamp family-domain-containing protein [Jimgerdemannia flammicorona]
MSNPFEDPSNPFEDPSITSALQSHVRTEPAYQLSDELHHNKVTDKSAFLGDSDYTSSISFHPYSERSDLYSVSQQTIPLTAAGTSTPPPKPLSSGGAALPSALSAKEEELRRKERELEERERALQERQDNFVLRRQGNNFPPCFPLLYMDIQAEIPRENQEVVTWLYRSWLTFLVTILWNCVACFFVLFSHPPSVTQGPADFGVSLTTVFTHSLLSFFLWYRPVYNAYMKEVSLYYFLYFIFNGIHVLYVFYMAVGIPSTGGAGLILLITLFSDGWLMSGVVVLIASGLWLCTGFLAAWLFKRTYDHYKAAGHTFGEAKRDAYSRMATTAVRSGAVDHAAGMYVRSEGDRFV